jgi:hypothetical protein
MTPDLANGLFEFVGACFVLASIMKLHREKMVRGVSWAHASFFWGWGAWNLFFYPHLSQWISAAGGAALFLANTIWLSQLFYYRSK